MNDVQAVDTVRFKNRIQIMYHMIELEAPDRIIAEQARLIIDAFTGNEYRSAWTMIWRCTRNIRLRIHIFFDKLNHRLEHPFGSECHACDFIQEGGII